MNDLNDAAFEPGLTSNRASSLRGRRSKGKGKGVRPRAFSLARPKFSLSLPLLTPVTHATGARRSAEMNLASPKALLNPG